MRINEFCRIQNPPIQFLRGEVFGLCGSVFADFGDEFHVADPDGEPCSSAIVELIEKGSPALVKCIFDDDGSGSIERDEFLRPNEGLVNAYTHACLYPCMPTLYPCMPIPMHPYTYA